MSNKVLSIVGPTGVGKSNLALWLARQCKDLGQSIEIISMDSALVYKGMNIGTAKPSKAEQDEGKLNWKTKLNKCRPYNVSSISA